MEEYFDVLNEKGQYTGRIEIRESAIKKDYGIKLLLFL